MRGGHPVRGPLGCSLATFLVVACPLYVIVRFNDPPFPLERLDRVSPGMTQAEVRDVLGAPSEVHDDGRVWSYSRMLSWPIVYVHFDEEGRVVRTRYDY